MNSPVLYKTLRGLKYLSPERFLAIKQISIAKAKCHNASKRAKFYGVSNTLKWFEWRDVLEASQGKCCYCLKQVGYESLSLEHIKPLARGGRNVKENIAAACLTCNKRKNAKLEFNCSLNPTPIQ